MTEKIWHEMSQLPHPLAGYRSGRVCLTFWRSQGDYIPVTPSLGSELNKAPYVCFSLLNKTLVLKSLSWGLLMGTPKLNPHVCQRDGRGITQLGAEMSLAGIPVYCQHNQVLLGAVSMHRDRALPEGLMW